MTWHFRSMAGARHGICELTARHGRGTAWARHAMCESAFNVPCECGGLDVEPQSVDLLVLLLTLRCAVQLTRRTRCQYRTDMSQIMNQTVGIELQCLSSILCAICILCDSVSERGRRLICNSTCDATHYSWILDWSMILEIFRNSLFLH